MVSSLFIMYVSRADLNVDQCSGPRSYIETTHCRPLSIVVSGVIY